MSRWIQDWPENFFGGPKKWIKMGLFRPKWTISVSRMLKFSSEYGHLDQSGRLDHFGPFWFGTLSDSTAATPYGWICCGLCRRTCWKMQGKSSGSIPGNMPISPSIGTRQSVTERNICTSATLFCLFGGCVFVTNCNILYECCVLCRKKA